MAFKHLPGSRPTTLTPRIYIGATAVQTLMQHQRIHSLEWRVFLRAGDSAPFYQPYLALAHVSRPDEMIVFAGNCPALSVRSRHIQQTTALFPSDDGVVELHPSLHLQIDDTSSGRTNLPRSIERGAYWDALARLANHMLDYGGPVGWPELNPRRLHRMTAMVTRVRRARTENQPVVTWMGNAIGRYSVAEVWNMRRDPGWRETVRDWKVNGGNADDIKEQVERWLDAGVSETLMAELLNRLSGTDLTITVCGHVEWDSNTVTTVPGDTYCEHCANSDLVEVHTMDTPRRQRGWYHRDDVYYWESDDAYHLEEEPEPEEDEEDVDDYHESSDLLQSWGSSTRHLAHDRSFTPSAYGDFTMGVEIEVEVTDAYERNSALRDTDSQLNADRGYAMFKRDGSLSETRGFEIVTAARRLGDHIDTLRQWEPHSDLRAWTTGSCGTHVHIDSRAFTALSLGKFLQLYNDPANKQFIRAIAGRHPDSDSSASSYARRHGTPLTMNPASIKKGAGTTRYHMVNLTNLSHSEQRRLKQDATRDCKGDYSTVEVRIFRATLKKERLLAQIEFAHASVAFCRVAGNHQLNGPAFLAWLGTCAGHYKHLARWFGVNLPRPTKQRPTVATAPGLAALAG